MWIFFVQTCSKRLKWPEGSEEGSPTNLVKIIPNLDLSVIQNRWIEPRQTVKQNEGFLSLPSLFYVPLPHTCQIPLLNISTCKVTPKNKIILSHFFSLLSWNLKVSKYILQLLHSSGYWCPINVHLIANPIWYIINVSNLNNGKY